MHIIISALFMFNSHLLITVPNSPINVQVIPTFHYNSNKLIKLNVSFSDDMVCYPYSLHAVPKLKEIIIIIFSSVHVWTITGTVLGLTLLPLLHNYYIQPYIAHGRLNATVN